MNLPLSIHEAQRLCGEFQHLIGAAFDGNTAVIEAITVTPYDTVNKQRFFAHYLLFDNDAAMALEDYKGSLFDVTILARTTEDHMVNESLMSWAARNNIQIKPGNGFVSHGANNQVYVQ